MQNKTGVKIREIICMDFFKGCEVLSGESGLDRAVTKVNVMEVPDIVPWLQQGEFLLTTAYSIRDNIEKLAELIPKMNAIGVAGIGIKTKRYVEDLPESVLELSNTLGFPIVRIPLELSFGDIITAILTTIVNNQMDLLLQIDEFNNHLKEIMLHGGDLEAIAKMIQRVVDAPVAITEELFKDYVICSEESLKPAFEEIVSGMLFKGTGRFKRWYKEPGIQMVLDRIDGTEVKRLMIPIFSDDVLYGYVVIWNIDEKVAEKTLFMIEAAASLIALHSAKKMSIYENENKHKIDFIEELLSPLESHQNRAIEKSNYFEFNKNKAYGVVLAKIIETQTDVRMTPNNSQIIKQLSAKLVSIVERIKRSYNGDLIYGNKSDRVIFIIGFDPFKGPEHFKAGMVQFSKELINYAKLDNMDGMIHIGMGRVHDSYKLLYKSHQEAERSIQKLSLSNNGERVLHFDDLGIYRILSNEAIQPELVQFFMEVLGPIALYDRDKDAELINTLKMYYSCGCNLKKVSEEMYTHYNTVIYRMQRIKEIGNIDFSDPNMSLNVHIAIKILDVIKLDIVK